MTEVQQFDDLLREINANTIAGPAPPPLCGGAMTSHCMVNFNLRAAPALALARGTRACPGDHELPGAIVAAVRAWLAEHDPRHDPVQTLGQAMLAAGSCSCVPRLKHDIVVCAVARGFMSADDVVRWAATAANKALIEQARSNAVNLLLAHAIQDGHANRLLASAR